MKYLAQMLIAPLGWLCVGACLVVLMLFIPRPYGFILLLIYLAFMVRLVVRYFRNRPVLTAQQKKINRITLLAISFLFVGGVAKFYHYNFIANQLGQANTLRLGLREFVCKDVLYKSGEIDHCGKRSIYGGGSHYWGVTAYYDVYGVETKAEAEAIAQFMVDVRKKNGQEQIPMHLAVYSVPRSAGGNGPVGKQYKIFDKDL